MPQMYKCERCGWNTSIGSYHGFEANSFNALYCRHCGASHCLETRSFVELDDPASLFLDSVPIGRTEPGLETMIHCSRCEIEGPLGNSGPITDEEPAKCPRCKSGVVNEFGSWMT